ncbi:hypothetical protein F4775DRAFT_545274 [Biscogniauxia sp. FL1348]|nr:hypothetical protein F4775DRAFT_545274 [Biscogniauxia sp. FL1348]
MSTPRDNEFGSPACNLLVLLLPLVTTGPSSASRYLSEDGCEPEPPNGGAFSSTLGSCLDRGCRMGSLPVPRILRCFHVDVCKWTDDGDSCFDEVVKYVCAYVCINIQYRYVLDLT